MKSHRHSRVVQIILKSYLNFLATSLFLQHESRGSSLVENVNGGLERLFHALGDHVGTCSAPGNASSHRFATPKLSLKGDNFDGKSQFLSTVKEIEDLLARVSLACMNSVGASVKLHAIFLSCAKLTLLPWQHT